jgi:hypothetical protein
VEYKDKYIEIKGKLKECIDPRNGRKFVVGQKITMPFHERFFPNGDCKYYDEGQDVATATVVSMSKFTLDEEMFGWYVMINFSKINKDCFEGGKLKSMPHHWTAIKNIPFAEEGAKYE